MPIRPFKHIALIGKFLQKPGAPHAAPTQAADRMEDAAQALCRIAQCIQREGFRVSLEQESAMRAGADACLPTLPIQELAQQCDLAVVVGGDGTMLSAARQLAASKVPLIGINQGRLGFMTDIALHKFDTVLPAMLHGAYTQDWRNLIHAQVMHGQQPVFDSLALNDVVINRGSTSGMIELRVHIDNHFVCNQRADGLIISTATGSTAYALSAGGPLMHPAVANWIIAPITPHTLSNRPIVISEQSCISIKLVNDREASVNFDAQAHYSPLQQSDRVLIRRAEHAACFLHPLNWNYFDTLREKLHWNTGGH